MGQTISKRIRDAQYFILKNKIDVTNIEEVYKKLLRSVTSCSQSNSFVKLSKKTALNDAVRRYKRIDECVKPGLK